MIEKQITYQGMLFSMLTKRLLSFAKFTIKHIPLIATMLVIQSCANSPLSSIVTPSKLKVNGVIFKNTTTKSVAHVSLKVDATNKYISCSRIIPENTCSTTFPLKEYQNNTLTIEWKQAEKSYSRKSFKIDTNKQQLKAEQYTLMITINNNGSASTQFVPN